MIEVFKNIFGLFMIITSNSGKLYIHPCERDISHLSQKSKITMAMGCSKVNGNYVYGIHFLDSVSKGEYE